MSWLLSDRNRPWIDPSKTDVMRTWKKFGFVSPEEKRLEKESEKKAFIDHIALQWVKHQKIKGTDNALPSLQRITK
jgi:hypothetical protein